MSNLSAIFEPLEKLTNKDGMSEFVSILLKSAIEEDNVAQDTNGYQILREFLAKLIDPIDELSKQVIKDSSILISVKHQQVLRNCFNLISFALSTCLMPGLGIPLSKRCTAVLPTVNLNYEEKYAILEEGSKFFTRSYRIPVLKNIIFTLHLSDYLAVLIQLAFAPIKEPGVYDNFEMTKEKYEQLCMYQNSYLLTYDDLVCNSFQPTIMKELLVLQSFKPPAFATKVITQELSRRFLAPTGLLSLIRCFIESYDIDTGFEWKKIDMICRIVSIRHGKINQNDYLNNISHQIVSILELNNIQYLTSAVACALSLNSKYPNSTSMKQILKNIFQALDHNSVISKSTPPGTIILSPEEVDHRVNILHACASSKKIDCHISCMMPNLYLLFLIGNKCSKSKDLKVKVKYIIEKCLEKVDKNIMTSFMTLLFDGDDRTKTILAEEYDSGIAIKSVSMEKERKENEKLLFLLDLLNSSTDEIIVKSVFEASLDILISLNFKRKIKANKDLLALEDNPILLDDIDEQYATILQLLAEMSSSPKIVPILKCNPSIIINFVEYFISQTNHESDECTTIALVLLNTVLSNAKKDDVLEKRFITIRSLLKKMSEDSSFNHILCKEALHLMSSDITQQAESPCKKAISEVFDDLLPVRAHGIIALTKLIDAKDAETISKRHYIFCIFQEQLKDPDSYVYLSAINGLASLCTLCTEDVLHVLCKEFLQISTDQNIADTNDIEIKISEMRMKTGDVLVKVIKRLGEMAVVHKTVLLNTMLCACRDDDPLIRTSALSNLAEIAQVLHYKIGFILNEVLLCVCNIIEMDKAVDCRRAAAMVITSLLKGLGKDTLIQLKENLLPVYKTLLSLYRDNDEDFVVKLHAQLALEELNDIVKKFLFPELKMEKQIFVLDKPEDVFK